MARKLKLDFLLLLLGTLSLSRTILLLWNNNLPDFNVFYDTASGILKGLNPYTVQTFTQFNYPPSVIFLFTPLTLLPRNLAGDLITLLSVAVFLLSIVLVKKFLGLSRLQVSVVFFLTIISFPFKFTLGMGQINLVILLLICLSLYFLKKKSDYKSVFTLSLATAIKLFPSILSFTYLVEKKYKLFFIFLVTSFALLLLPFLLGKGWVEIYYLKSILLPLLKSAPAKEYYNQSMSGALYRLSVPISVINLSRIAILIISLSLLYFKKPNPIVSYGFLIIASLILSPFSWQHHFVLLILPFSLLLKQAKNKVEYLLLAISYLLVSYNISNPNATSIFLSHVFIGTLILFLFMGYKIYYEK